MKLTRLTGLGALRYGTVLSCGLLLAGVAGCEGDELNLDTEAPETEIDEAPDADLDGTPETEFETEIDEAPDADVNEAPDTEIEVETEDDADVGALERAPGELEVDEATPDAQDQR